MLIDKHGRNIKKLRLSLLDACNMNCFYCMPEKMQFMKKNNWMSANEIFAASQNLVDLGIKEIRLTGGEPTLRSDFLEIADKLSLLPLDKLALTTNGLKLNEYLKDLRETKLSAVNISLDSLNKNKFREITKTDQFETVMHSIMNAKEFGLNVKINAVLLKGINDSEIDDFINFSKKYAIPVRFLEVMKIGEMIKYYDQHFLKGQFLIDHLELNYEVSKEISPKDSTSINFKLTNGAQIGLIASETMSFCGQCSRLRMGADGTVYPCLFVDSGVSIKGKTFLETKEILSNLINNKPIERINQVSKAMHAIGG